MQLTKELKKYIKSLQQVKYRQKYNKFIAEGPKICIEILESGIFEIEYLVCTAQFQDTYLNQGAASLGKTIICNDNELKSISSLKNPNKILIVAEIPEREMLTNSDVDAWMIYCDGIQDPGNMGAILRIADWFGIAQVIASEDSVDFYNSKVVQSAMGAHCRVGMKVVDRKKMSDTFGESLYVLSLDGGCMTDMEFGKSGILVVGNEGRGVSKALLEASKHKMLIKKYGGAESLNASVACGIACHYIVESIR